MTRYSLVGAKQNKIILKKKNTLMTHSQGGTRGRCTLLPSHVFMLPRWFEVFRWLVFPIINVT